MASNPTVPIIETSGILVGFKSFSPLAPERWLDEDSEATLKSRDRVECADCYRNNHHLGTKGGSSQQSPNSPSASKHCPKRYQDEHNRRRAALRILWDAEVLQRHQPSLLPVVRFNDIDSVEHGHSSPRIQAASGGCAYSVYVCGVFHRHGPRRRGDAEVVFVGARQRYGARASSHPAACDHAAVPLSGTRSTCVATTAAPAIQ